MYSISIGLGRLYVLFMGDIVRFVPEVRFAGQLAVLEAEDDLKSKRISEIQDFLKERMQELRQKEADLAALRSQTSADA